MTHTISQLMCGARVGFPALLILMLVLPGCSVADLHSATKVDQIRRGMWKGSVTPSDCLTEAEVELARLVNKLREEHRLSQVPVVEPLYNVAKWHVIDLAVNAPHRDRNDDRGMACTLHSWSENGNESGGGWAPLCYTSDHSRALGMWNKPREISEHRSNGYEIVYWTSAPLSPAMAINYWNGKEDELDMILERNNWKRHAWRSMGVGIYGNYAAVWFSEKPAPDSVLTRCVQAVK